MGTAEDRFAKTFHDLRGYIINIHVTHAVKLSRVISQSGGEEQTVNIKLLYLGASSGKVPDPEIPGMQAHHPENDPYAYQTVFSPFPEEPDEKAVMGVFRDDSGALWSEYYAMIILKDPQLYETGLKIVFEVPDVLAEKKPVFTLLCDGEKIHDEILDKAGVYTRTVSVKETDREQIDYLKQTRHAHLSIVEELNRLCLKYDIRYYLICGGLIGAVRDGALLPWDDDLDLAMTREDFTRLKEAVRKEWEEDSDFLWLPCDGYEDEVFYDFMTRIIYRKQVSSVDVFSRLEGRGRRDIHYRCALDLYVLDNASDRRLGHAVHTAKQMLIYGLCLGHRPGFDTKSHTERGKGIRSAVMVLQRIGSRIPLKKLHRYYQKLIRKTENIKSGYYYLSNGYYRCFGMRFKKEWFGKGKREVLGGVSFCLPQDAENFLKTMYGDYEQYPPQWERMPMHYKKNEG